MSENAPWPPKCEKCGFVLTEAGAVILGPPFQYTEDDEGPPPGFAAVKDHLCVPCYYLFLEWLIPPTKKGKCHPDSASSERSHLHTCFKCGENYNVLPEVCREQTAQGRKA